MYGLYRDAVKENGMYCLGFRVYTFTLMRLRRVDAGTATSQQRCQTLPKSAKQARAEPVESGIGFRTRARSSKVL